MLPPEFDESQSSSAERPSSSSGIITELDGT